MCDIYLPVDDGRYDIISVGSIMGYNAMECMMELIFFSLE